MAAGLNRNKTVHTTEKCPFCQGTNISRTDFGLHGRVGDLVRVTYECESCSGIFYVVLEPVYWLSLPEARVARPLSDLVLEEEET
jgi:hypothetical protein